MTLAELREMAAALIVEWPRFEWHLRRGSWTSIHNRGERLVRDVSRAGFRCDWRWTSQLRLPKSYPGAADRLYRAATAHWPIPLRDGPTSFSSRPDIAFVIPHKGATRVGNLLMTLKSAAAQRGVTVECIVVEQGEPASRIEGILPSWVRHVLVTAPTADMPFNKSWLLNIGVQASTAEVLVLHDNDMLVPEAYAREVLARFAEGFEVADLKRFIFYMDERSTRRAFETGALDGSMHIESVVQNLTAGGTMAISRSAYDAIGGYDESFYGWGGHDTDFWERALTRRVDPYGYLPILHLWHAASSGKERRENDPGTLRYLELERTDPHARIAALLGRPSGKLEGPVPPWTQ
jgi:hypothetical protein